MDNQGQAEIKQFQYVNRMPVDRDNQGMAGFWWVSFRHLLTNVDQIGDRGAPGLTFQSIARYGKIL
jgi:hypothetical protein